MPRSYWIHKCWIICQNCDFEEFSPFRSHQVFTLFPGDLENFLSKLALRLFIFFNVLQKRIPNSPQCQYRHLVEKTWSPIEEARKPRKYCSNDIGRLSDWEKQRATKQRDTNLWNFLANKVPKNEVNGIIFLQGKRVKEITWNQFLPI